MDRPADVPLVTNGGVQDIAQRVHYEFVGRGLLSSLGRHDHHPLRGDEMCGVWQRGRVEGEASDQIHPPRRMERNGCCCCFSFVLR